jgi:hypothetical protein
METLTHLVSESFARHGFDRPLDYRRLHWSRWLPCTSPRSLLLVPSKPGVFALAEQIAHGAADAEACPETRASRRAAEWVRPERSECARIPAETRKPDAGCRTPDAAFAKRMLAVLQFCEADDMAFVLDRMFSRENPMRVRLASGRCFIRYVVLEDSSHRRGICNALNQWLLSSTEATTGIGAHFATSLELTDTDVARTLLSATGGTTDKHVAAAGSQACPEPNRRGPRTEASGSGSELDFSASRSTPAAPQLDSGAAANLHCPQPFPSGF